MSEVLRPVAAVLPAPARVLLTVLAIVGLVLAALVGGSPSHVVETASTHSMPGWT